MQKSVSVSHSLLLLPMILCLLPAIGLSQPQDARQQHNWLMEQLYIGEARYRDDLVQAALYRLERLAPNDPDMLLAQLRLALRQKNSEQAKYWHKELQQRAPQATQAQQKADTLIRLYSGNTNSLQTLKQARLLALSGRTQEALALYEKAFAGPPPDLLTSLEYWRTQATIPARRSQALQKLQQLDRQYPGNIELRLALAKLLFSMDKNRKALEVLHQLAKDPLARDQAAQLEINYLQTLPVKAATLRAWKDFLHHYGDSPLITPAQKETQRQQALLDDPYFRAGLRGQQQLARGQLQAAERNLRRSLTRYPKNSIFWGDLGMSLLRQGNRASDAHKAFQQALKHEQNSFQLSKWHDLIKSTRYWMLIQQGQKAYEQKAFQKARRYFQQARRQRPREAQALIGLARVALAEQKTQEAESLLKQVRRLDPNSDESTYLLLGLYRDQGDLERAQTLVDSLPPKPKATFTRSLNRLRQQRLEQQANEAAARGDTDQQLALLKQALQLFPEDPWLTYRLARILQDNGRGSEGDAHFQRMLRLQQQKPEEARYAYSLYLSMQNLDQKALDVLQQIAPEKRDQRIQDHALWLEYRLLFKRAEMLRAKGEKQAAKQLLLSQPTVASLLKLGNWALEDRQPDQAEQHYQRLLAMPAGELSDAQRVDARLGQLQALIDLQRPSAARTLLRQKPFNIPERYPQSQHHLAKIYQHLGLYDEAQQLYQSLLSTSDYDDPLLYRDAARLLGRSDPEQALDLYAQGMHKIGLLPAEAVTPERDDKAFTAATLSKDNDGWLESSLRYDVEQLYQWQSPRVHLHHDYGWRDDDAAPGTSDLKTHTTILQVDWPLAHGTAFLRGEHVDLDNGTFDAETADGRHFETFGTCALGNGCRTTSERETGIGFALGWQGSQWAFDLGHSPQGFEVTNWLGGISYQDSWGDIGWDLTLSRRPMNNSILSYAGARDPQTGIRWGGVTANGLTLGLSHDTGGAHGVWASLSRHWLRGDGVASNNRYEAMTGYYYKLINKANERWRVGVNLLHWGYARDLGEYTLGQGGYYSPQEYFSIGLPTSYAWRNADWSVLLEGSIGWSHSRSQGTDLYPEDDVIKLLNLSNTSDLTLTSSGGTSSGYSTRLQGAVERRLDDHWVLGGSFAWQEAEDYAPGYASLYLRYSFDSWLGNLPLPVEPLRPYAEFR